MRSAHWMLAAALACSPICAAWAIEGDGLVPRSGDATSPSWQGRLSLGTAVPLFRTDARGADGQGLKVTGASLMGDYYFTRSLGGPAQAGGFRTTSGLFLGSRSLSLLSTSPTGLSGRAFSVDRRSIGTYGLVGGDPAADAGATPYLGVGYTGLSNKGGWGFSADLGLMALNPGSAAKLGRVFGGNQSLEDLLRELRLSPLLHLGVSYSF